MRNESHTPAARDPKHILLRRARQTILDGRLAIVLLAAIFFGVIELFHPYYFLQDDARDCSFPMWVHDYRSLLEGHFPSIDFYQHLGTTTAGNGTSLAFYPLVYACVGLSRWLFGHAFAAVDLFALLHFCLGALGFFCLARHLGLRSFAAGLSTLAYLFSSYHLFIGSSWANVLAIGCLYPALLFLDLLVLSPSGGSDVRDILLMIVAAALHALLFFLGHPQFFFYAHLFEVIFLAFLLPCLGRRLSVSLVRYVLVLLLAVCLSLPEILPMVSRVAASQLRGKALTAQEFLSLGLTVPVWLDGLLDPTSRVGAGPGDPPDLYQFCFVGYPLLVGFGCLGLWGTRICQKARRLPKVDTTRLGVIAPPLVAGAAVLFGLLSPFLFSGHDAGTPPKLSPAFDPSDWVSLGSLVGGLFSLWMLLARGSLNARRRSRGFLVAGSLLATALVALAFSGHEPLMKALFLAPLLNRWRWPFKNALFVNFFFALACGAGLDFFLRSSALPAKRRPLVMFLLAAMQVMAFVSFFCLGPQKPLRFHAEAVPFDDPVSRRMRNGRVVTFGVDQPSDPGSTRPPRSVSNTFGFLYPTYFRVPAFGGYDMLVSRRAASITHGLNYDSFVGPRKMARMSRDELRVWGVAWYVLLDYQPPYVRELVPVQLEEQRGIFLDPGARPLVYWSSSKTAENLISSIHASFIEVETRNPRPDTLTFSFLSRPGYALVDDAGTTWRLGENEFGQITADLPAGPRKLRLVYRDPEVARGVAWGGGGLALLCALLIVRAMLRKQRRNGLPPSETGPSESLVDVTPASRQAP